MRGCGSNNGGVRGGGGEEGRDRVMASEGAAVGDGADPFGADCLVLAGGQKGSQLPADVEEVAVKGRQKFAFLRVLSLVFSLCILGF